jgi:cyanosortase A-associated protein
MKLWPQLRIFLIGFTCVSVFFVLAAINLSTTLNKGPITGYSFPQRITLPEWQFTKSNELPQKANENLSGANAIISGKRYQLIQNDVPLIVEVRLVLNTDGNIQRLVERSRVSPISIDDSSSMIREKEGVGIYGLSIDEGQAYLDTCLNTRGKSTFTREQFMANQTNYIMQPGRLIALLWGQERLNDHRCLWIRLALPISKVQPKAAYPILEKAWLSLYPQLHKSLSKT